jgi:hypothetical protein
VGSRTPSVDPPLGVVVFDAPGLKTRRTGHDRAASPRHTYGLRREGGDGSGGSNSVEAEEPKRIPHKTIGGGPTSDDRTHGATGKPGPRAPPQRAPHCWGRSALGACGAGRTRGQGATSTTSGPPVLPRGETRARRRDQDERTVGGLRPPTVGTPNGAYCAPIFPKAWNQSMVRSKPSSREMGL